MDKLTPNMLIAALVLPLFYLAIYIDLLVDRWRGSGHYDWPDTVASLGVGIANSALGAVTIAVRIAIYTWAYTHAALFEWSLASPWTWVLGLLLYDFSYYWQHRMGHEWNLLWASHVVHHSSDRFNLSTALRVPSATMNLWTWLFALPLAVLGVPPVVYAVATLLNLLYQFWIHTERVGRLGWFDRVFGSPSNHRVHHGVNERYLDKNYGGILMLWDQLFGTYEDERADEPVRFGTRAPVRSFDVLWINLDTFWKLCRDALATRRAWDRVQLWWRGPGWRPADVAARDPKPAFDLSTHEHLQAQAPGAVGLYTQIHVALLVPPMVLALIAAPLTSPLGHLWIALHVAFGAQVLSMLAGPRWKRALALEALRLLSLLAFAIDGAWLGGFAMPEPLRWAVVLIALASLAALPLLARRWDSISGSPTGDRASATAV